MNTTVLVCLLCRYFLSIIFCSLTFLMNMLIYHVFITCLSYARLVTIAFLWGELLYFTPASLIKVSVNWHPLHQCFVGCSWVCVYIQPCSRVLMSHSETLLHGSNEHQPFPVEGVIMELHGEQRWAAGAETGVMPAVWYLNGDWLCWWSPNQLFSWQRHLRGVTGVNIFLFISPFVLTKR